MVMTLVSLMRKPIKSVLLMGTSFRDPPSAQQKHSVPTICHGSACLLIFFATGKDLGFDVTFPKDPCHRKVSLFRGPLFQA